MITHCNRLQNVRERCLCVLLPRLLEGRLVLYTRSTLPGVAAHSVSETWTADTRCPSGDNPRLESSSEPYMTETTGSGSASYSWRNAAGPVQVPKAVSELRFY